MRQLLNNTGLPLELTTNGDLYTILDLTLEPEELRSRVHVVTLYALYSGGTVPAAIGSSISCFVEQQDATMTPISTKTVTGPVTEYSLLKILDGFPLRGNLKLLVGQTEDAVDQPVHVFGYVEIEGVQKQPLGNLPLEPVLGAVGNNESPFTYSPVEVSASQGNVGIQVAAHAFSNVYLDEITLEVSGSADSLPEVGTYGVVITVADGVSAVSMRFVTSNVFENLKLFDGIPFRAASLDSVGGLVPGIHAQVTDGSSQGMVWGRFKRY